MSCLLPTQAITKPSNLALSLVSSYLAFENSYLGLITGGMQREHLKAGFALAGLAQLWLTTSAPVTLSTKGMVTN